MRRAISADDGWTLVVDDDAQPQGWLASGGLPDAALAGTVTAELLNLGGTLATQAGTLREALDAALSSPSGRGVVVRRRTAASPAPSPRRGAEPHRVARGGHPAARRCAPQAAR